LTDEVAWERETVDADEPQWTDGVRKPRKTADWQWIAAGKDHAFHDGPLCI
jgi:hypothetical protein